MLTRCKESSTSLTASSYFSVLSFPKFRRCYEFRQHESCGKKLISGQLWFIRMIYFCPSCLFGKAQVNAGVSSSVKQTYYPCPLHLNVLPPSTHTLEKMRWSVSCFICLRSWKAASVSLAVSLCTKSEPSRAPSRGGDSFYDIL